MKRFSLATASFLYLLTASTVTAQGLDELIPLESEAKSVESTPESTPTVTPTPVPSATPLDERAKARVELLKLPKSGILSSSQISLPRGTSSQSWGEQKDSNISPPIAGSVSTSGKNIIATIKNNSKETLSISARVIQKNKKGVTLKTDSLSMVLAPGKSLSRSYSTRVGATANSLEMSNWKILSK